MREPPSQSLRLPPLHCGDWERCANWITASRGRATVPDELEAADGGISLGQEAKYGEEGVRGDEGTDGVQVGWRARSRRFEGRRSPRRLGWRW